LKKVAFYFDIDGFTHPYGTARKNEHGKIWRGPNDGLFVWAPLLDPILAEFPDMDLYCNSHWRTLYTYGELVKELPPNLAQRTLGVTDPDQPRYDGIQLHAKRNGIDHYVMGDDDPWEFPMKTPANLVVVPSHTGISEPGAINDLRTKILRAYKEAGAPS
jgi:hypothetical protein